MPLLGSLPGFPPAPTHTPSSVIAQASLETYSQGQWPPRDTHTQRPQGSLDFMWEMGSASPRGPQVWLYLQDCDYQALSSSYFCLVLQVPHA